MCRGRRGLESSLRIRVRRRRWRRWCDGRRVAWQARGWRECGRHRGVRRSGQGRATGRATGRKAECGFRAVNGAAALDRSCRPIYGNNYTSKEPICLCAGCRLLEAQASEGGGGENVACTTSCDISGEREVQESFCCVGWVPVWGCTRR